MKNKSNGYGVLLLKHIKVKTSFWNIPWFISNHHFQPDKDTFDYIKTNISYLWLYVYSQYKYLILLPHISQISNSNGCHHQKSAHGSIEVLINPLLQSKIRHGSMWYLLVDFKLLTNTESDLFLSQNRQEQLQTSISE